MWDPIDPKLLSTYGVRIMFFFMCVYAPLEMISFSASIVIVYTLRSVCWNASCLIILLDLSTYDAPIVCVCRGLTTPNRVL